MPPASEPFPLEAHPQCHRGHPILLHMGLFTRHVMEAINPTQPPTPSTVPPSTRAVSSAKPSAPRPLSEGFLRPLVPKPDCSANCKRKAAFPGAFALPHPTYRTACGWRGCLAWSSLLPTDRAPPLLKKPSSSGSPFLQLDHRGLTRAVICYPPCPLTPGPFGRSWRLNIPGKRVLSAPASCGDASLPMHSPPPATATCYLHHPLPIALPGTEQPVKPLPASHFLPARQPTPTSFHPTDASHSQVLARFLCRLYVSENGQGTDGTLKRVYPESFLKELFTEGQGLGIWKPLPPTA